MPPTVCVRFGAARPAAAGGCADARARRRWASTGSLRSLGSGSNAEVFLAEPLQRPADRVVVKRIHDHVVAHPKFRQLFEAEVRSMANFDHPYAVRFLDAVARRPARPVPGDGVRPGDHPGRRCSRGTGGSTPERVGRLLGLLLPRPPGRPRRRHHPPRPEAGEPDGGERRHRPNESLKVMDFGFAGFAAKPHIQLAELTGHGPIYAIGTPGLRQPGDDPRRHAWTAAATCTRSA